MAKSAGRVAAGQRLARLNAERRAAARGGGGPAQEQLVGAAGEWGGPLKARLKRTGYKGKARKARKRIRENCRAGGGNPRSTKDGGIACGKLGKKHGAHTKSHFYKTARGACKAKGHSWYKGKHRFQCSKGPSRKRGLSILSNTSR